jgi:dihydrodiol dehydrogenase / D-xylose 1-dehydrogenase (NADP)
MNREQYSRLAKQAEQQGVVLMEAMWTRYLPVTKYLQETLLRGIGRVKRVYSKFSLPIAGPELSTSSSFWIKKRELAHY